MKDKIIGIIWRTLFICIPVNFLIATVYFADHGYTTMSVIFCVMTLFTADLVSSVIEWRKH